MLLTEEAHKEAHGGEIPVEETEEKKKEDKDTSAFTFGTTGDIKTPKEKSENNFE